MAKKKQPDETTAGIGHNVGGMTGERLRSFVQRIERLEEDKAAIAIDLREVYAELKAVGYAANIVRQIIRERKIDIEKRRENAELLELYKAALGYE